MPSFRRKPLFAPNRAGTFDFHLSDDVRQWLIRLAEDVQILTDEDTDDTRRLFPTAYPDDADRDAGYQILARGHLMDQRNDALAVMRHTAHNSTLTQDELAAWMRSVNDVRLVLGTRLDVGEDDAELDLDSPDFDERVAYENLGAVLHHMVDAMSATLDPGAQ